MPVRHADRPGAELERSGSSSRAVMRLRAWVVCLSFAVCLPAAGSWELSWPARAVATLVSAAVGVAALPRSVAGLSRSVAALSRSGHAALPGGAAARSAVLLAPCASAGALAAPPRTQRERAPGFDGRQLYLELCTLTC